MCAADSIECSFGGELAALIAQIQSRGDQSDRGAIFDALTRLEDRALAGGAPALTLRKIAEVRFLVGILREAVRPAPVASLRALLRMRAGPASRRRG